MAASVISTGPGTLLLLGLLFTLLASPTAAQGVKRPPAVASVLQDLSAAVEDLTAHVSMSVVQVLVTGYGRVDERAAGGETGLVIGRQRSSGSGAIITPDGYIVTNAHVVSGARQVEVVLHGRTRATDPVRSLAAGTDRIVDARVVGVADDIDLALLKVEVTGLTPLPFADYDALRQGQIVFAFGSPAGLLNSVTMGVISSVARQPNPDSANLYIQTDAPINPGNSGGPLVNVDGELVGLNTLILSDSGGSEGLGFAIPSAIVASVYPQLRQYGHVHRGLVGFNTQAITPALAGALGLGRASGVMVSDVMPDGPADRAGLEVKDVITHVDHKPVNSVPMLALELSRHTAGDTLAIEVLRGTQAVSVAVPVIEQPHPVDDLASLADPEKNAIPALGIIAIDVKAGGAQLASGLRIPSGVLVAAQTEVPSGSEVRLAPGDVIHAVNGVAVDGLDGLRALVGRTRDTGELVLQIERNGLLQFVTCHVY